MRAILLTCYIILLSFSTKEDNHLWAQDDEQDPGPAFLGVLSLSTHRNLFRRPWLFLLCCRLRHWRRLLYWWRWTSSFSGLSWNSLWLARRCYLRVNNCRHQGSWWVLSSCWVRSLSLLTADFSLWPWAEVHQAMPLAPPAPVFQAADVFLCVLRR